MVDWKDLAKAPCYPVAADNAEFVGQLTGYALEGINPATTHLIGYSLGAHVAAIAARVNGGRILRVTGEVSLTENFWWC